MSLPWHAATIVFRWPVVAFAATADCGSFPAKKASRGGNRRAHERQSLPIIFKLYNLTTLQLNAVSP